MDRTRQVFIFGFLVLLLMTESLAIEPEVSASKARYFVGQDLHLSGVEVVSYGLGRGEHALVFQRGFSMSIGDNEISSDRGVVWLERNEVEFQGVVRVELEAKIYLQGGLSIETGKGAKAAGLEVYFDEEDGQELVVKLDVRGEVFVTAEERQTSDPRGLELYRRGQAAVSVIGPKFVVQPEALVPEWPSRPVEVVKVEKKPGLLERILPFKKKKPEPVKAMVVKAEEKKPGLLERIIPFKKKEPEPVKPVVVKEEAEKPRFMYPVNIAPAGEVSPKIEKTSIDDGTDVATVIGRMYVWQKQGERGGLLELQADNAVIYYSGKELKVGRRGGEAGDVLASGAVQAIYMSGDVIITEGRRTIRASELYYDFRRKKAVALEAELRNFDVQRGIPIYVRAAKLRQLAENEFTAEDVVLTSSEFHKPQISAEVSTIHITDTSPVDAQVGEVTDSSFDAQMTDVRFKAYDKTIFKLPFMRSNLQRPDVPLRSAHIGHDNTWGTSIETEWYLSRILGLREPEGTESLLNLDYYSDRGFGAGGVIEYERDDYYGRILGYVISDSGEDKLGRHSSRRDLKPDDKLRGRFRFQHRHFLPNNWQLTTEVSHISDEGFLEGYYQGEFDTDKKQETLVHLKRLEDNWGISILGKGRINDFADELEEMPSVEFHLTGESLFEDKFTLYSDTQLSRFRQRIGDKHAIAMSQRRFSFLSHRTELDMPFELKVRNSKFKALKSFKVVPFVAGTIGYDDRSGFTRSLVDGSNMGRGGDDQVWIGEAGVRVGTQFSKLYPKVKSKLWDLNRLRHIIKPELTAVLFEENDSGIEQRDVLNVGISQRLQTKRGEGKEQRTVDWMRLDIDFTWVNNSVGSSDVGPDRFIWNQPMIPLRVLSAPDIFNGDLIAGNRLQRFEMYGPRRNYFGADYVWRLSDTTILLSDINYDMQTGVAQQFNVGFSRLVWPNLSYYIGSRYLRRVKVLNEKGSNAFVFAATYELDPRYTIIFGQQFDFDYGANIRSDISLIRKYHRMYWGFTFSADQTLDRQAVTLSIWPQGIPELALGSRRYAR